MVNKKITILDADDWQWLFIDGICYCEGHEITQLELLQALGVEYEVRGFEPTDKKHKYYAEQLCHTEDLSIEDVDLSQFRLWSKSKKL